MAVAKKIETRIAEHDTVRKKDQQMLLQKYLNSKNELKLNQSVTQSKLSKSIQTKNYAQTIVGKLEGTLRSVT